MNPSVLKSFDLAGGTALVTGSSAGIGYALARGLAEAGARVVLNARNAQKLEHAADRLRAEGAVVHTAAFDVTDSAAVEPRIPELQMGRVDVLIANLAYTRRRAAQIDFSYAYYVAREELVVHAADAARTPADFRGQRISATKGSTSEQSIRVNGGVAVTYQDTGAAYFALQQHKVQGFVTNSMTAHKLISQVAAAGVHLSRLKQPMALEPVAIGMRKGEFALAAKVNEVLNRMDRQGRIDSIWNHWLGPGTLYDMRRKSAVTDIAKLDFQPLP
jgi:polar amino acid transport system substrate-binding protein